MTRRWTDLDAGGETDGGTAGGERTARRQAAGWVWGGGVQQAAERDIGSSGVQDKGWSTIWGARAACG